MGANIVELYGYSPTDQSPQAKSARRDGTCPFIEVECTKRFNDGVTSGACTLKQAAPASIICCPNRLYAQDYLILKDVATAAFGAGTKLILGKDVSSAKHDGKYVAVFGKKWGKELRLPKRGNSGSYFVDWILALIGADGKLSDFCAVEVQTIDTTGTYRTERDAYVNGKKFVGASKAGLNWENVNKRILPQLIYKGHVLRQEPLCSKGLFFVCPAPVYNKITERLGGVITLRPYTRLQPGSLTFRWYDLGAETEDGKIRDIVSGGQFSTTVDQVALNFTSPQNLPQAGVYADAINQELKV
jgi:hypothetical protein